MRRRWVRVSGAFGVVAAIGGALAVLTAPPAVPPPAPLPDLTEIHQPQELREAFFAYLYPIVTRVNEELTRERYRLMVIDRRYRKTGTVRPGELQWLSDQRRQYRIGREVELEESLAILLRRLDTVPVSLVLAQAAIESGWGTSRFAREGNSLFGQQCFDPGCGIVPLLRPEGARHEVAAYDTVDAGVRAYLHNLNTHPAYGTLRAIRAAARAEQREPSGMELAEGLLYYSERRDLYVQNVRTVIRNHLEP